MLEKSVRDTSLKIKEELDTIPLSLFNESILRYFFCKKLLQNNPRLKCQIEWYERIDLFIKSSNENILIEFKFYQYPKRYSIDCKSYTLKGYPSNKNFDEFRKCVEKLEKIENRLFKHTGKKLKYKKYIILAYVKSSKEHKEAYESYYNNENLSGQFNNKLKIQIICEYPIIKNTCEDHNEKTLVFKLLQLENTA